MNMAGILWLCAGSGRRSMKWKGDQGAHQRSRRRTLVQARRVARISPDLHRPSLTLKVDDRLAAEVIDNDPKQFDAQGNFGLQLHSGPPTRCSSKIFA